LPYFLTSGGSDTACGSAKGIADVICVVVIYSAPIVGLLKAKPKSMQGIATPGRTDKLQPGQENIMLANIAP
jgi:hypothetical protein